ncbi:hypothetical protein DRN86_01435 [Candidatus Geothermarchaeota archaeon]|nr:MAG: hypothetical protein DRN86_01435 [Candidatus Geothermarchaeota archaeon]
MARINVKLEFPASPSGATFIKRFYGTVGDAVRDACGKPVSADDLRNFSEAVSVVLRYHLMESDLGDALVSLDMSVEYDEKEKEAELRKITINEVHIWEKRALEGWKPLSLIKKLGKISIAKSV